MSRRYMIPCGLVGMMVVVAAVTVVAQGGTRSGSKLLAAGFTRVEDVADSYWYASLSKPLLDPENNNRPVRALAITVVTRHDQAGVKSNVPLQQAAYGIWLVDPDSREAVDVGLMGFPDERGNEFFRFSATAAPAGGKTWAQIERGTELTVQVMGKARK